MAHIHVLSPAEEAKTPHWKAAVWSGLIAGVVFLVLEMLLVSLIAGDSPWAPMRMMAAILLGQGVLPPPATFDVGIVAAAMVVHFALAIGYGLILSLLVFRLETGPALLIGALFGLGLYVVNFYGFTAVFPWFAMARNGMSILAHAVFGLTAAWAYKALAKREARGGIRLSGAG